MMHLPLYEYVTFCFCFCLLFLWGGEIKKDMKKTKQTQKTVDVLSFCRLLEWHK